MRKFTVTAFAVCYAALLVFGPAERTGQWAHKEAISLTHFYQLFQGSKNVSKDNKSDSHLYQTRLLESGFVVELPREAAASPIPSQRLAHRPTTALYISTSAERISSRGPPILT